MPPHRTFSARTNEVWLARGRVPVSPDVVLPILRDGLERIAGIRAEIAKAARVATMPPVEVVPYLWRHENSMAHGAMAMLPANDGVTFGVRLPAQTAACKDDSAVRAVLVHEFAHCFYFAMAVVNGTEAGADLDLRKLGGRADEDVLANPHEWFGVNDAARFIHWDDPSTSTIAAAAPGLLGYFFTTKPDSTGPGGSIRISDDVKAHIRDLRAFKTAS